MQDILEYLAEVEGTKIHYNKGESDITSNYGIYRAEHPNAEIFIYIDSVARSLGINKKSKKWTRKEIAKINSKIDMVVIDRLAIKFYDEFLESLHLNYFSKESKLAAFSLYTNGPYLLWKSVQKTINNYVTNGWIDFTIQDVDGQYGSKTKNGLLKILELSDKNDLHGYLFESMLVSGMQAEYARLACVNPKKYLKYLRGWNNRVTKLLEK